MGGLLCIDWASAGVELWGTEAAGENYGTLDVQFLPCGVKETLLGGKEDRIPLSCNYDKQAAMNYIGPMQMVAYFNEGKFQLDDFGHSRIKKRSVLRRIQVDETRPNWIGTTISKNLLIDASGYLHYGLDEEAQF